MELIDSHCHLETFWKEGTLEDVLQRARAVGVRRFVTVGTRPEDWELYQKLATMYSDVFYTVGLHPCEVREDWEAEMARVFAGGGVAVGEIGLDYFHLSGGEEGDRVKEWQRKAFFRQLKIAVKLGLPAIVHSRDAFYDCVELVEKSGVPWEKVVFHCFTHGEKEAEILRECGGLASFTGIVTYKNAEGVRKALKTMGVENVMIETDSPYLAPVPYRGKRNEPCYLKEVAEGCAGVLGMGAVDFVEKVRGNTERFFV